MTLRWLKELFADGTPLGRRSLGEIGRFALGVCPGCRGLRAVASARCTLCRSDKRVIEDA